MKVVNLFFTLILGCILLSPSIAQKETRATVTHTVAEGENLYRISLKYRVSMAKLCEWNGIQATENLVAGRELLVSPAKTAPVMSPPAAISRTVRVPQKAQKQRGETHHVQTGETLSMIANAYGYTDERFRRFNGLAASEQVTPGQVVKSCDCTCAAKTDETTQYEAPKPRSSETTPTNTESTTMSSVTKEGNTTTFASTTHESTKSAESSTANKPETTGASAADKAADEKAIKDAPTSSFMSPEEMAMVDEINLARTSPKVYVQYVNEYIKELEANQDNSAVATAKELIEQLEKMSPCVPLSVSECVFTAAKKHALDQKMKGDIDHQGRDGSFAWDRVPKECPMMKDGGECLVGGGKTVRKSMLLLLVDDGIANRGHRNTILNPEWRFVGCYKIGQVGKMANYWIQNYGF